MKPPKHCYDKTFRYVPAANTDISKSIKREIARLKSQSEAQAAADEEARVKTTQIRRAK